MSVEGLLDSRNNLVLRYSQPVACSIAKAEGRREATAHIQIADSASELGERQPDNVRGVEFTGKFDRQPFPR
jgi:hypothetical protein